MERDIIEKWLSERKASLTTETIDKMLLLAKLIHETNMKFNLTGLKTKAEILSELILKSIDPLCDITVPRGTSFVDLGTGSGVPGIPLCLFFGGLTGILLDANQKKTEFIKSALEELGLGTGRVLCGRAEEIAHLREHREHYDWCFARAFGKLYITLELGAPFVKPGGHFFIYSTQSPEALHRETLAHSSRLGLDIMSHGAMKQIGLSGEGLCFTKASATPEKYPRKYPTIKREADKLLNNG